MTEETLPAKQNEDTAQEGVVVNKELRNSFVFYRDWYEAIKVFDDKTRLEIYDAILKRVFEDKSAKLSPLAEVAMRFVNPQIERDIDKWLKICKTRSDAGKKHKGNQYTKLEQNGTNGTNGTSVPTLEQNGTNGTDNVNDNDIQESKDSMSIKKKVSNETKKEKPLWKTSYEEWKRLFEEAREELLSDEDFKRKQEDYYPNIDYAKSIEKGMDYWLREDTWKKVSRERVQAIRAKERLEKNFDKNRIFFPYNTTKANNGYPRSVDDVKLDDVNSTWDYYVYWAEKSGAYKLYEQMNGGFPENNFQYQYLLQHTIGGAKAFAYVVLVFMRDGWKEYDDERGFMWIYSKYVKANGLFKE